MRKLLFILQIFIKCSLIFLICFIWLRFILDSLWLAIILSFAITLTIELITVTFKRSKGIKNSLKAKEKEDAENMFYSLLHDKNKVDFFYNLAKSRHQNVSKNKSYVLLTHADESKVALVPFIKIQNISADAVLDIFSSINKVDKIVIVCNDYDSNLTAFIKNLPCDIVLQNKYETYENLYKEYDFYPQIITPQKKVKHSFKDFLSFSFNRTRAKGYIISAIMLFILSFFVQMSIYYCVIASLLLIFALISLTYKQNSKKIESDLL